MIEEIRKIFNRGSLISKLIYINVTIFLLIRILAVILMLFKVDSGALISWLALPSDIGVLATRPWTLFTYMFLHYNFFHILVNMLWLYWFGKIFTSYIEEKKIIGLYIMGGIAGGVLYVLAYNIFPAFENIVHSSELIGASASIIAIVVATAVYAPNIELNLLFISSLIGPVKIVWIAVVSVFIYILGISGSNAGGNIAHIGGAIWGFIYMIQLRKGKDIMMKFNNFVYSIGEKLNHRQHLRVTHRNTQNMSDWEYNKRRRSEQDEVNKILEKIGKSGYGSLTKSEKELLFKMGNRNKN